jgi:hypothetical protein
LSHGTCATVSVCSFRHDGRSIRGRWSEKWARTRSVRRVARGLALPSSTEQEGRRSQSARLATSGWFAEGIAQFLETIRLSDDGPSVIVRDNNAEARASFLKYRAVTLMDALTWHGSDGELSDVEMLGRYGTSWVLFHWLCNRSPRRSLATKSRRRRESSRRWRGRPRFPVSIRTPSNGSFTIACFTASSKRRTCRAERARLIRSRKR